MRSIVEELYYGNISPTDRDIVKGGEYAHLLNLVTQNEDALTQTPTQAQQEIFEKFNDCASELHNANEMTAFTIGFKLGLRLTVEAMLSTSDITDPKMNSRQAASRQKCCGAAFGVLGFWGILRRFFQSFSIILLHATFLEK